MLTNHSNDSSPTRIKEKSASIRQLLAPVHTWTGLFLGWLLYLMFFMGTLSYIKDEFNIWSIPHLHISTGMVHDHDITNAIAHVQTHYPQAKSVFIDTGDTRTPMRLGIQTGSGRSSFVQLITDEAGAYHHINNHSRGGEFFYRLHFDLHYLPVIWARYLTGLAGMLMLIAIITGVVIHKKIFTDFFTFRRRKGQRSWLDAHNAFSVLPLPFHLMITFTGIMTLAFMYLPWGEKISPEVRQLQSSYRAFDFFAKDDGAQPAPTPDITPLLAQTKRAWGMNTTYGISTISINHMGTDKAQIAIEHKMDKQFSRLHRFVVYDYKGDVIRQNPTYPSGMLAEGGIIGMHLGRVADWWLRFILLGLGVAGVAMIATGLIMWTVKRRTQLKNGLHFGFRLVESLNIGTILGIPLATASYLWANRLLPIMNDRAKQEILIFFITWGISYSIAIFAPKKLAWLWLSYITSIAYLLLPIISIVATDRGFISSLLSKDWLFISFDVGFLLMAILFWHISRRITTHEPISKHKSPKPTSQPISY